MKKIVKVIVGALVGLSMIVPQTAKANNQEGSELNQPDYWITKYEADGGDKIDYSGDGPVEYTVPDLGEGKILLAIILKAGNINANQGETAHQEFTTELIPGTKLVFELESGKIRNISHVIWVWKIDEEDSEDDEIIDEDEDEIIDEDDEVDEEEPDDNDDEDQTDPIEEEEEEPVDEKEEDPVDEEVPVDEEEPTDEEEPVKEEPKEEPVYVEPIDESLPKTGSVDSSTLTLFGGLISSLGILFLLPKRKK